MRLKRPKPKAVPEKMRLSIAPSGLRGWVGGVGEGLELPPQRPNTDEDTVTVDSAMEGAAEEVADPGVRRFELEGVREGAGVS